MDLNPAESFISFSCMAVLQVALGPAASLLKTWCAGTLLVTLLDRHFYPQLNQSGASRSRPYTLSPGKIAKESSDPDVRLQVQGRVVK